MGGGSVFESVETMRLAVCRTISTFEEKLSASQCKHCGTGLKNAHIIFVVSHNGELGLLARRGL